MGAFIRPNVILIFARSMYNVLSDPSVNEDRLFAIISDFAATIHHELTHWVQANFLHPSNSERHYNLLTDTNLIPYYTSQIEFDPTLKDQLSTFAANVHTHCKGKYDFNQLVHYFTGSIPMHSIPYPGFDPSQFFYILKQYKPEMYAKALKLFGTEVKTVFDNYKVFTQKVEKIEPERKDYIFGKLRANEFNSFVTSINTFIDYPETRILDYNAMAKHLAKIDDKFKRTRAKDYMFLRCSEKLINLITVQKKALPIPKIFVDHEIVGTGMMFNVSGVPMILDIDLLTHDPDYIKVCEEYDINMRPSNSGFAVLDGEHYLFKRGTLMGVYRKGKKVE